MTGKPVLAILALGVALVAAAPAAASPGTVGVTTGTLLFQAGPGTANAVDISGGKAAFTVKDTGPGATLEFGTGCKEAEATCGEQIVGAAFLVERFRVILGDGNDSVQFRPLGQVALFDEPARINGGPGNDRLTGPDGPDVILAGPGANTLRGAGGNDRLEARNGRRDVLIDCGTGTDTAVVDRDDPLTIGCETILRPAR